MKTQLPEQYRAKSPGTVYATQEGDNFGAFKIPHPKNANLHFKCLVGTGMGWDHVSVTVRNPKAGVDITPTWDEMCHIKDIFFDKTECVVQYHPIETDYVNFSKHTLHLWRQQNIEFPTPNRLMV